MKLHPVPPEHVDTVFQILEGEVYSIAARSAGRFDVDDLRALLKAASMFAWCAVSEDGRLHAIVLAEVVDYPKLRVCRLVGCAGRDRKKWLPLLSGVEIWAASVGCSQMHAIARKGWAGDLPEYRLTHVYLEKDLGHVERRVEAVEHSKQQRPVGAAAAVPH